MKLRDFLTLADDRTNFRIYTEPNRGTKVYSATHLLLYASGYLLNKEVAVYGLDKTEPPNESIIISVLLMPHKKNTDKTIN